MISYATVVFRNVLFDLKFIFKKVQNKKLIKDTITTRVLT
jgi:hypothetical protein